MLQGPHLSWGVPGPVPWTCRPKAALHAGLFSRWRVQDVKIAQFFGFFFGGGPFVGKKNHPPSSKAQGFPHVGSDILVEFPFPSVKCDLNLQFVWHPLAHVPVVEGQEQLHFAWIAFSYCCYCDVFNLYMCVNYYILFYCHYHHHTLQ